jgi:Nif-specific regulatory protein
VVEIRVPPLRDRKSDIPLLAQHFLKRFVRETGRKIRGFTAAALHRMEDYAWPGNVRELKNVIERGVALGRGPLIDLGDLFLSSVDLAEPGGEHEPPPAPKYDPRPLKDIERAHVLQTLEFTDWKKSQAAAILGIERSTLDRKIEMYQLKRGAG